MEAIIVIFTVVFAVLFVTALVRSSKRRGPSGRGSENDTGWFTMIDGSEGSGSSRHPPHQHDSQHGGSGSSHHSGIDGGGHHGGGHHGGGSFGGHH